ncbi:hypothetical protein [Amnibacterium endophyticum]|uniref:Uncharacterized protein n=1 Tax=Amnibacterium endophyticum TaxID=2109337 RepID=A0ABW4LBN8_9MICO
MWRRLRRLLSWDGYRRPGSSVTGEEARDQAARDRAFDGRSSGSDTGYMQRFGR